MLTVLTSPSAAEPPRRQASSSRPWRAKYKGGRPQQPPLHTTQWRRQQALRLPQLPGGGALRTLRCTAHARGAQKRRNPHRGGVRQEWLRHRCHRCRQSASCQTRKSPTWTETSRIRVRLHERALKTVARVLLLQGSRYRVPRRGGLRRVLFCYHMRSDEGSAEAYGKKTHTAAKFASFRVQQYGGGALKAVAGRARSLDAMQ